jgi:hypothetical protein
MAKKTKIDKQTNDALQSTTLPQKKLNIEQHETRIKRGWIQQLRKNKHSCSTFTDTHKCNFFSNEIIEIVTGMLSFTLIFLWFIYQNVSNSWNNEQWNNTHRYEIWHTLNLDCSFITLREPCNNQPRFHIAWLHVTNLLCHGLS